VKGSSLVTGGSGKFCYEVMMKRHYGKETCKPSDGSNVGARHGSIVQLTTHEVSVNRPGVSAVHSLPVP